MTDYRQRHIQQVPSQSTWIPIGTAKHQGFLHRPAAPGHSQSRHIRTNRRRSRGHQSVHAQIVYERRIRIRPPAWQAQRRTTVPGIHHGHADGHAQPDSRYPRRHGLQLPDTPSDHPDPPDRTIAGINDRHGTVTPRKGAHGTRTSAIAPTAPMDAQ